MIKFLDLHRQYLSIKEEIDAAIAETIENSAYIGGPSVSRFEAEFAAFQQSEFCVGVGNGTDALEIVIEALGLEPQSEIIVPANTFIATAEAVSRCGHKVVFCDHDSANMTISVEDVARRITSKTSAIIAVHLYGHPCDMNALLGIADKHKLAVIEDSAQAHGAEYRGRRVGSIARAGTFSFFPGKNLGAFGDGGAITTNDNEIAERCRRIANHGRLQKFDHDIVGGNSRLDAMQAAILSVKLKYLDRWTEQRIRVAKHYRERLASCPDVVLPHQENWARHVYHLFAIRCKNRDGLQSHLSDQDIASGIHYPCAIPKTLAYVDLGYAEETLLANSEDGLLLSLPMGDHMDDDSVNVVCDAILAFYR